MSPYPGTWLKSSITGRSPYRDTVRNGSTLRKSGIHDPQLDAKVPKPTPKNRKIDALEKSLNDRLCRAL